MSSLPSKRLSLRIILAPLASAFIVFLTLMVITANCGEGDRWWSFIHSIPYGDKLGHIGLMTTLSLLCNIAFTKKPLSFRPSRITLTLFIIVSLEEISQAFIPTRNFDPLDWLANLIGLAIGQATSIFIKNRSNHCS